MTDRVELTEDAKEALREWARGDSVYADDWDENLFAVVASIVESDVAVALSKFQIAEAQRDAARAELAAANASTIEAQKDATYNLNRWRAALAERDALQATLDRISALPKDWKRLRKDDLAAKPAVADAVHWCEKELRAALDDQGRQR